MKTPIPMKANGASGKAGPTRTAPANLAAGGAPRPKSGLIDQSVPATGLSSDAAFGALGCGLAVASVSFGVYMSVHGPAPHEPGSDFSVFAQLAPRPTPASQDKAEPPKTDDALDMTATASIPRREEAQGAASRVVLQSADGDGATVTVGGRSLTVRVGDTIPGAGTVLAIYPGRRALLKTSRGTIVAAGE